MSRLETAITSQLDFCTKRVATLDARLQSLPSKTGIRADQCRRELALFREMLLVIRRHEKLAEIARTLATECA